MNAVRCPTWRRSLLVIALLGLVLAAAPVVFANTRVLDGDVPFYARIDRGAAIHTEDWAFVVFYRPAECVPADFNLLDFYDVPAAFGCAPPTTDGFLIFPEGSMVPLQSKLSGRGAVPVWFSSWAELSAAMDDDVLTITELEALPSLIKGTADFYNETLHPWGAAQVGKISLVGSGLLQDGRVFQIKAVILHTPAGAAHVEVRFR